MDNISLVIVTDDKEYGRALGQALLHLCSRIFVQIMRKEEFFSKRAQNDRKGEAIPFLRSVDLILWDGEEAEDAYGGRIILLSEKQVMAVKNFQEKKFCIYKYSQAQSIIASLFEVYSFLTGKQLANMRKQQVRMLSFSSCMGGAGCTVIAMAVAQELCRFGDKKVLYVSFEDIESTGEFIDNTAGVKGVGVYLYYLFKSRSAAIPSCDNICQSYPAIESYIIHDDFGLEAFPPTQGKNPLGDLTDEELEVFVASLMDSGRYDVLIFDLGSTLSKVNISCMEMSERICFVSVLTGNNVRENQYLQHLICCCGEDIIDKLVKTQNMADNSSEDCSKHKNDDMIDTKAYIGKSETFLQHGEVKRIFLDGSFGQEIKELTKKLIKYS